MESETPADAKIFYKDTKNELKGPHTEREVQALYRDNWFDSLLPFYFMTGDEQPTDQTEFHTLGALRTLNGIGCPFVKPDENKMKPETPVDAKIFFRNMLNVIKGPYTERQVQEWYREDGFKGSIRFYFMKDNQRATEQTEFRTLRDLCKLNGPGCPFASIEQDLKNEEARLTKEFIELSNRRDEANKEKIRSLDKELADLSKKCEGVQELEQRLGDAEKRFKVLTSQLPPISSSSAAAAAASEAVVVKKTLLERVEDVEMELEELATRLPPTSSSSVAAAAAPTRDEQLAEDAKLGKKWAAYYLDVLEAYSTDDWNKVGEQFNGIFATIGQKYIKYLLNLEMCRAVLMDKLPDYIYCSECDSIFHNYGQILLHVMVPKHNTDDAGLPFVRRVVNLIMEGMFKQMIISYQTTESISRAVIRKYKDIDPASPKLRPLQSFIDHVNLQYFCRLFDYAVGQITGDTSSNRAQIAAKMIERLKQNDGSMGRQAMSELDKHIGNEPTRCYKCKVATGNREEYYKHLRSFPHQIKSDTMDVITLVVNIFKRD